MVGCSTTPEETDVSNGLYSSSHAQSGRESSERLNSSSSQPVQADVNSSSQMTKKSSSANRTWSSMEEAIDFYEANIIADKGKEMGMEPLTLMTSLFIGMKGFFQKEKQSTYNN